MYIYKNILISKNIKVCEQRVFSTKFCVPVPVNVLESIQSALKVIVKTVKCTIHLPHLSVPDWLDYAC